MKKILIIAICTFYILPVCADNYFAINWSDFCPRQYANIDVNKSYKLPIKKYWQQRRIKFEERKNFCSLQKEKDACFKELREYENNKTQLYYSEFNSILNKANLIY